MATTEGGRKYAIARLFLKLSAFELTLAVFCAWLAAQYKFTIPDTLFTTSLTVQSGVVMAFIAGNAAVSYAFSDTRSESRSISEATTREIKDRRDHDEGIDPA